ncbi:MAG: DUF4157 domain-containing protein [Ignavibacteria bacterium]|jgi:hypothetical protein
MAAFALQTLNKASAPKRVNNRKAEKSFGHLNDSKTQHSSNNPLLSNNNNLSSIIKSASLQTKLKVGKSNDKFEQEADMMAERVMNSPSAGSNDLPKKKNLPVNEREEPGVKESVKRKKEDTTEEVQRKSSSSSKNITTIQLKTLESTNSSSSNIETTLENSKGGGKSLPENTRSQMEEGFGADFSNVNIHTGPEAVQMNKEVGAQAFTYGNNIYFNQGKYNPGTSEGNRLIAHELTHTIQQSAVPRKKGVQKQAETTNTETTDTEATPVEQKLETGIMDNAAKTIKFDKLPIPSFKQGLPEYKGPIERPKGYHRTVELGKPQKDWKEGVGPNSSEKVKPKLIDMIKGDTVGARTEQRESVEVNEANLYVFNAVSGYGKMNRYVIGNLNQAVNEFSSPTWDKAGKNKTYHVDHIKELQLGGADELGNMHLLSGFINMMSGFRINSVLKEKVKSHLESKNEKTAKKEIDNILSNYKLVFNETEPDSGFKYKVDEKADIWTPDQISAGEHFNLSKLDSIIQVGELSKLGDSREFLLFPSETGWIPKKIRNTEKVYANEKKWLSPFTITSKQLEPDPTEGKEGKVLSGLTTIMEERSVSGKSRIKYKTEGEKQRNVTRYPGAAYTGFIDKIAIKNEGLNLKGLSPITLTEFEVSPEQGISAKGEVLPTVPIIKDVGLQFKLENGAIEIFKQFNTGEISLPHPFSIIDSSLTLSANSETGLGFEGQADFEIAKVGKGCVMGKVTSGDGFELEGQFDFDSTLFDPASIKVGYKSEGDQFSAEGELGIRKGKIQGINEANIKVSYADKILKADGSVKPEIPGVEEASLNVVYSEEEGLTIGGQLNFNKDIPYIKSGVVDAKVQQKKEGEGWELYAKGTAVLDIPGIDSTLSAEYSNGVINIEGTVGYERGMLSGSVTVGATNMEVDAEGKPTGGATEKLRAFGGGQLTLKLTPWLEAGAGVKFLPNGELEITGKIGLPDQIDLFPRKEIDKNLFKLPTIEIPIFAIPLGTKSVGLVAMITGGVDLFAGVGPGTLKELGLEVKYNPDHEEDTTISGKGLFVIPADAGVRLFARAGLGVSIAVASASGNIEIGGSLGLEAEARAEVNVNWTPKTGLELDAEASVSAQPKFKLDISFVLALEAFWIYEYEWRKVLKEFEYGSGLKIGVALPIKYKEGEPFKLSLDDAKFEIPDIDIPKMAKEVGSEIAGDLV